MQEKIIFRHKLINYTVNCDLSNEKCTQVNYL